LIKKKSVEHGRPLKVISDWDEVITGNKSRTFYLLAKKRGLDQVYSEWLEDYWKKSTQTYRSYGMNVVTHLDVIENYRQNAPEEFEAEFKAIKADPNFYDDNPFLFIAGDLFFCLKEGLISELIIISSYREEAYKVEGEPKRKVFEKHFAKFPQCKLELTPVKRDVKVKEGTMGKFPGKRISARWKVLKEKFPNFDVFIDDNPNIMKEVREAFSDDPDKTYVFPDYKCNSHIVGDNIYRVSAKKPKLRSEEIQNLEKEQTSFWKQPSFYYILAGGLVISLLGISIFYLIKNKKQKS
jgi:hypothetical protein